MIITITRDSWLSHPSSMFLSSTYNRLCLLTGNAKMLNPMPIEESSSSIRRACSLSDLHMGNFGKRKIPHSPSVSHILLPFLSSLFSQQIEWQLTENNDATSQWQRDAFNKQTQQSPG